RTAGGWQISIAAYAEENVPANNLPAVGIDRGVAVPLALSDGRVYDLPESIERIDKLHKQVQRIASRRKRGSGRHARAIRRAARLRARQARIRKDWAHRTTTDISRLNGAVVV
ncbi:transposase, partial [Roseibium sp. RKSG952]|uniref:transposase n=1 Tax=Roseibium sp. RKSG952 TaxID=2529384 RepID=UPI0012BCA911